MANQVAFICSRCLKDYPNRRDLLVYKCFDTNGAHARVDLKVNAEWDNERRRLRLLVRPMPRAYFKGPFILCDGRKSCKGPKCTYPHCREELDAWNRKKRGSSSTSGYLSGAAAFPPQSPLMTSPPPRPPPGQQIPTLSSSLDSLAFSSRTFADVCAVQTPHRRTRFLSEPTAPEPAIPPTTSIQQVHISWEAPSPWPDLVMDLGHQPAVALPMVQPNPSPQVSNPLVHAVAGYREQPPPTLQVAYPYGFPSAVDQLVSGAMSIVTQQKAITPPAVQRHAHRDTDEYAASKEKFHDRRKETLHIEDIQQDLTRANYKEKFHKLLCWEEKEHIDILDKRCDGRYTLVLHQAGLKPPWMKFDAKPYHKRFGYISGLSGDQIAYATQASEGAVICGATEIRADILRENFNHTDDRLYIALDHSSVEKLTRQFSVGKGPFKKEGVRVEFELKHFYFDRLHQSIKSLSDTVVTRIMPEAVDFPEHGVELQPLPKKLKDSLRLSTCSSDQKLALQTIVSCPSSGPPVLIAGPFGTGKTRILATAVQFLFQQSKMEHSHSPIRVLVCTQQQVSADTFLQCYFDILPPRDRNVFIARLIPKFGRRNPDLKRWYKTVSEFRRMFERSSHSNESDFLVVTTCNTSLSLTEFLPRRFFTHILLDEGAQMREPEGIAPLSMAGPNTKIVIAGDQHQVGPAMLVLGDEPQDNGLAVSLLERLQNCYQELGAAAQQHCVTLVTNYRCHSGIIQLAAELFYETPLHCWDQQKTDSSAHPDAPFPLQFVCSSIDDTVSSIAESANESEARIALNQAHNYAAKWPVEGWGPPDLNQVCFVSTTRSQVTTANRAMGRMPVKLKDIRRIPTYDIQGREYRAIFISTSEPTDINGKTCNPTKSISDRYVFNTAITRARSLVVAVGNPFMLLRMEKHMVEKYKKRGECWSSYLRLCLKNNSLSIDPSLQLSKAKRRECLNKLRERVGVRPQLGIEEQLPVAAMAQVDPQLPPVVVSVQDAPTGIVTSKDSVQSSPPLPPELLDTHQEEEMQEGASPGDQAYYDSKLEREFAILEILGKGGFGVVCHVLNRNDEEDYAVKIVKLPTNIREQEKVKREVKAFVRLKGHPRVVHYQQSWTAKAPRNVTLRAYLKSSDSLPTSYSAHSVDVPEDPSSATSPSTATSPSHSTETSVGETQAESSNTDSMVVFKDSHTSPEQTVAAQGTPQATPVGVTSFANRPTCLFIQIELCEKDTLKEWLRKNVQNRERRVVFDYFAQILEAVIYIHGKQLIHRDLKPSNIFFSREDNSVKVGDFGLVAANISTKLSGERQPKSRSSHAGTLLYMAPEQLEGKNYDAKVDIFALGVILSELNCPFPTDMERHKVLTEIRSVKFPSRFQDKLPMEAQMIEWLLSPEPSARPSGEAIMKSDRMQRLRKAVRKAKCGCVPTL